MSGSLPTEFKLIPALDELYLFIFIYLLIFH